MDTVLSGKALVRSQEQIYVSVYTDYIIIYCIVSIYIGIQLYIKNCAKGTKQDVAMQAGVWFLLPNSGDLRHRAPGYQTETPVLGTVHGDELQIFLITLLFHNRFPKRFPLKFINTTMNLKYSCTSSHFCHGWFDALIYSSTKLVQVVIRNLSIALLFGSVTKRSKETS